jgi:hypothetical protein
MKRREFITLVAKRKILRGRQFDRHAGHCSVDAPDIEHLT